MMPSPPAGASHGDENDPDGRQPVEVRHLTCRCQRGTEHPLSLCGLAVLMESPDVVRGADPTVAQPPPFASHPSTPVEWCIVCHDLARTALIAGRCERCVP